MKTFICSHADEQITMVYLIFFIASHFLLNSSNAARLSSFESQQLSQLIINEEQSRHYVENDLTSLEQRVSEVEHDLKTKYVNDIADAKITMKVQINRTKALLEQEMNATKATLDRQTQALEKEKYNRRQLEREYARLMMNFHNLSLVNTELGMRNVKLEAEMENNTKEFNARLNSLLIDIQAVNVSNELQKRNLTALESVTSALQQKAGKNL